MNIFPTHSKHKQWWFYLYVHHFGISWQNAFQFIIFQLIEFTFQNVSIYFWFYILRKWAQTIFPKNIFICKYYCFVSPTKPPSPQNSNLVVTESERNSIYNNPFDSFSIFYSTINFPKNKNNKTKKKKRFNQLPFQNSYLIYYHSITFKCAPNLTLHFLCIAYHSLSFFVVCDGGGEGGERIEKVIASLNFTIPNMKMFNHFTLSNVKIIGWMQCAFAIFALNFLYPISHSLSSSLFIEVFEN